MRLVFLNRFYWPDSPATAQLLTDLAESLAAQGREVVVLTGQPASGLRPAREERRGVTILRVRSTHFGNRHLLTHALDFASFAVSAIVTLFFVLRRSDTLVVLTDPPLLAVPAVAAARLRGARVINWVQDIYPEVAMILTGRRIFSWMRPLRDWAWKKSTALVTLGTDMAALPLERGVPRDRLHLVANWAPDGVTAAPASASAGLRAEWGLTGKFVVAYFGNLGRVHDLEVVLDVAEALRDDPEIVFAFIGPGAQRPALEAAARTRGLDRVKFFPQQPRERRTEMLALGDLHLVTLRPGCERVVFPSKLYGICAAGRALLFIGPTTSEIARVIVQRRLGVAFDRVSVTEIAAQLRRLRHTPAEVAAFAAAGLAFYESDGSLRRAAAEWTAVLAAVEGGAKLAAPASARL